MSNHKETSQDKDIKQFVDSRLAVNTEAKLMRMVGSLLYVELEFNENLVAVANHMKKGGSVVLMANHESHADSAVLLWHVMHQFREHVGTTVLVAGSSLFPDFYDDLLKDEEKRMYAKQIEAHRTKASAKIHEGKVMTAIVKQHGYELVKTIQASDFVVDDPFSSTQARIGIRSHQRMNELLTQDRTVLIYYPQGSRESRDKLAPQGISKLIQAQKDEHVMFLPVGLIGTNNVLTKDKGFRDIRSKITVNIGVPKFAHHFRREKDDHDMKLQDLAMGLILNLIPKEQWGAYLDDEKFMDYKENHFQEFGFLFETDKTPNG
jgi:1-acyl-sn-glycerol-3-phosphate acyltransferase